MLRVSQPELLDSDNCSPAELQVAMRDLGRINRWFGGVRTTEISLTRIAQCFDLQRMSLLEVAAGSGEVPAIAARTLARQGVTLDVTLLDRAQSHLPRGKQALVGDALALPFPDQAFDVVGCTLFAHHLAPSQLAKFAVEAVRVSRRAVLINDLVRHPIHLGLVYAAFPIIRSRTAWLDGITSVRRSYSPDEMRDIVLSDFPANAPPRVTIEQHYLFRMSVILWKGGNSARLR